MVLWKLCNPAFLLHVCTVIILPFSTYESGDAHQIKLLVPAEYQLVPSDKMMVILPNPIVPGTHIFQNNGSLQKTMSRGHRMHMLKHH